MSVLGSRTPHSDAVIVRRRDQDLGVNGVPGDTIDRPGVAAEDGNGLVPLDVEDVNLVVLGA